MRRFIRILTRVVAVAVLAFLLLAWCVCGWWPIPSICGGHDARVDVSKVNFKELRDGRPFPGSDEYTHILHDRYGIEVHYVGYCTTPKSTQDYADAYDRVSTAAAKRKFGHDVFKETYDEAVKNWKLAHPAKAAN
jgi:hypothetical protein